MSETKTEEIKTDVVKEEKKLVQVGEKGIAVTNVQELLNFCKYILQSGLAPKSFQNESQILVAIQTGMELGLPKMAALNSLTVINGRVGMYSETALALIQSRGLLQDLQEKLEGEGETRKAVVTTLRKGIPTPRTTEFSVSDAKKAGLWGKQGPWSQYPDRMLLARARGFNFRDAFPDVLKGTKTVEELEDYPVEKDVTPKFEGA